MPATTQPRISVGSRVHFPHRCAGRMSRCDGQTASVAQLTCGGLYAHQREGHVCGEQFAHLSAACGKFVVAYAAELVEA